MKNKAGRPSKPKTITPGLRIDKEKWNLASDKFPKKINKMFNEWIDNLLLVS